MEQAQARRAARGGRRGGRAGKRNAAAGGESGRAGFRQLPWEEVINPYPPMEPLSADQVEAIHEASLTILETHGIEVLSSEALEVFARAGADVDRGASMVRLDRGLVMEAVGKAPSSFTLQSRNPARTLTIGGAHINFALVSGPPNVHDCINGRRAGNWEDYCNLIRFAQSFNVIRTLGNQASPPIEMPANTRHLDLFRVTVELTDKVFSSVSIGRGRVRDHAEVIARSRGITLEQMADAPGSITNINVNSPRRLDAEMCAAAMEFASIGQAVVVTPFTLMGAMTPVTMAAALAQQNAEALCGIALTQLVRPGAPVVYGAFTSNVDMRTGAPAFGTPENAKANLAGGQLARRYDLPHRTSACNAANTVDAQAVWETQMALWSAVMAYGNLTFHAAGWLEGGLVSSFEKIVVDVEMLQHMVEFLKPIRVDDAELGLDAIASVPPGGHFFGAAHTMDRYETAFYAPFLSDWQNHENWVLAGSRTATERATETWRQVLRDYGKPPLDPARLEAIQEYVAKRKEEIGAGEP